MIKWCKIVKDQRRKRIENILLSFHFIRSYTIITSHTFSTLLIFTFFFSLVLTTSLFLCFSTILIFPFVSFLFSFFSFHTFVSFSLTHSPPSLISSFYNPLFFILCFSSFLSFFIFILSFARHFIPFHLCKLKPNYAFPFIPLQISSSTSIKNVG